MQTMLALSRKGLIAKIDSLKDIEVQSTDTPYQMEIKVKPLVELRRGFRHYFSHCPQQIPKIIHQIWIGPNKPPWSWINSFRKNFMDQHPDWEYHLWREADIAQLDLFNRNMYESEEALSGKANILRYEILFQFGGIYIDADSEWLNNNPLQNLIDHTNPTGIFAGWEDNVMLANSVIGCSVGNPLMYYVIKLLRKTFHSNRQIENRPTWVSSGPRFFSEALLPFNITKFPIHYFYPVSWHQDNRGINTSRFTRSYMIQYGYSTNKMFNEPTKQ